MFFINNLYFISALIVRKSWLRDAIVTKARKYQIFVKTSMADYREVVLQEVAESGEVDTLQLAQKLGVNHQVLVGVVKSLQSVGDVSLS